MSFVSQNESVKPVQIDYTYNSEHYKKCTYTRDSKPEKDPFEDKRIKGEWL